MSKSIIYAEVPKELKQAVKIQCVNLDIDQKDFVIIAIEKYLEYLKENVNLENGLKL
jgi:hypothetical protein